LLLARNVGLPSRFGVYDDATGEIVTVAAAWRRGPLSACEFWSGPARPLKRSDRTALAADTTAYETRVVSKTRAHGWRSPQCPRNLREYAGQSSTLGWRNRRIVGYHGESARSRSQRHSRHFSGHPDRRPSAPAKCAIEVSQVTTRSRCDVTAAASTKASARRRNRRPELRLGNGSGELRAARLRSLSATKLAGRSARSRAARIPPTGSSALDRLPDLDCLATHSDFKAALTDSLGHLSVVR